MPSCHGFSYRQPSSCEKTSSYSPEEGGKYQRMFEATKQSWDDSALEFLASLMIKDGNDLDSTLPSGYVYLAQFIDHDLTFDTTPLSEANDDLKNIQNYRTPILDLDSLYGAGPKQNPFFYKKAPNNLTPYEFLIGETRPANSISRSEILRSSLPCDLPRASSGFAIIPDPRNDENLILAQLHLAFMKFHNAVVQKIHQEMMANNEGKHEAEKIANESFELARKIVIHSYQKIIQKDFLPKIINIKDDSFDPNKSIYLRSNTITKSYIPIEFSGAAYRFGHSMIRPCYTPKKNRPNLKLENSLQFTGNRASRGFTLGTVWLFNWNLFFDLDGQMIHTRDFNFAKMINPYLSSALTNLATPDEPQALALRNLKRGKALKLPSGQEAARESGIEPLSPSKILEYIPSEDKEKFSEYNLHQHTPLWYYILKEAEISSLEKVKNQEDQIL